MKLRVLVVDDSRFYRNRVIEMLSVDPELQEIDTAENGAEALKKVKENRPDVIIMDVEMPVMDGIQAVREIMKTHPTPILMYSSLTTEGAKATLDALDAGALDFVPKRFEDISGDRLEASAELCRRVKQLGRKRPSVSSAGLQPPPVVTRPAHAAAVKDIKALKLIAIGTSTGGPAALQNILSELPADFPIPIVVVQHMPAAFTGPFAQRLDTLCRINVKEAKQGDLVSAGTVLIAPGGKQMELDKSAAGLRVKVRDSITREQYKPSVDITFTSAADEVGSGVLAIVLTGMGNDGKLGATELKKRGSLVWAQDEASCVVYGMPLAVVASGLADQVLALSEIGVTLARGS